MLKKKWGVIFSVFTLIAFIDSIYLTYLHHMINIIQPDYCPICFSKYSFLNFDSGAVSKYAYFFGIPVSTLAIFAYLFIIIFLSAVLYLKKDALRDYLLVVYPMLLLMLLFSLYEFYASLFIIKALCVYCVLLYVCIIAMTIACKRAVESSHKEIFQNFSRFMVSLFAFKTKFNVTLIAATFAISVLFAYGADLHYRHKLSVFNAKKIDKQKDRVIELLKGMLD